MPTANNHVRKARHSHRIEALIVIEALISSLVSGVEFVPGIDILGGRAQSATGKRAMVMTIEVRPSCTLSACC